MTELRRQFAGALLVILTVAAVISAAINFQQQGRFRLPEDGVTWMTRNGAVEALYVASGSPAGRAGLKAGDRLLQVGGAPVGTAEDVTRILVRIGAWNSVKYTVERSGVPVTVPVIVGEQNPGPSVYYQYLVGLAYLGIGLFVYYRRGNAERARHFYVLCLASFVLSTFHYTGKLNNFDQVIYWGNVAAGLFAPTVFLHFTLAFPESRRWLHGRGKEVLLYLPAALLFAAYVAAASGLVQIAIPAVELRWLLDRVWLLFLAAAYLAGAAILSLRLRRTEDPIVRQQLKWLRNGAVLGVLPFVVFYVVPYSLGAIPGVYMKMAVLSLAILPLAWAYAVLRYRLMDVDVIFQQGYVYTLATLCILGSFYGLVFSLGRIDDIRPAPALLLILIAAFAFQPLRGWIQGQLDKYYFYKDRYDYRRTLIEFARELSSETDLDAMLASVADRLMSTLSAPRVAFFLADESRTGFGLRAAFGMNREWKALEPGEDLDLSFLPAAPGVSYLFFEQPRYPLDVASRHRPPPVRKAIARLDLTYYVPCLVRGRTIAYLGLSRTDKGDFLSSDDLELLVTLAGYVGIAVENARLYQSLQGKVEENERLKEFNENIVESINVGILAADLEDRVESWNARMEQMTGIPREKAVGQLLGALFPDELMESFDRVGQESGVRHVYKLPVRFREALDPAAGAPGAGVLEMPGSGREPRAETPETILNVAIAPLVARDERRIGRLVIFDDVTAREDLERRLVQADKLSSVGLLAAGVAHEVNTPLAVISTYAQMLAKQVSDDQQKSVLLDRIAKQTFRASEIVNSLLNFSRTSPREFVELDLGEVIRETLALVQHQLDKSGIGVKLGVAGPLPPIRGSSGQLQQVFLNLFLNARDAMDQGGRLEVRVWEGTHGVEVEVADTGPGIPLEHVQRIYDPFFTTKGARKGTGLGLSVTYGIVRNHGGMIEVDSRPGEGAKFHLEFPVLRKAVNA